ncbi:MAG: hypothetical protein HS108_02715 [Planctomycetes bacterium]|jgi:methionyl-tRNA synthetase|nr:hypothetical protein [Planctomycetota bacterium]
MSDPNAPAAPAPIAEIGIEDFAKVELRTARVLAAAPHPDADKLLVLTVDAGDGGGATRTICAGIRTWWAPEAMVGRDIVIVANLKPRKLRGVLSQGMLLAVTDGDSVVPLSGARPVSPGLRVS